MQSSSFYNNYFISPTRLQWLLTVRMIASFVACHTVTNLFTIEDHDLCFWSSHLACFALVEGWEDIRSSQLPWCSGTHIAIFLLFSYLIMCPHAIVSQSINLSCPRPPLGWLFKSTYFFIFVCITPLLCNTCPQLTMRRPSTSFMKKENNVKWAPINVNIILYTTMSFLPEHLISGR